jgi:hypothetical protein
VFTVTVNIDTSNAEQSHEEEVDSEDQTTTAGHNAVTISTEDVAAVGQLTAVQHNSRTKHAAASDSNLEIGLYVNRSYAVSDKQKYNVLQHPWRPPVGFSFPYVMQKNQRRFFNSGWLDRYSWLSYSKLLDSALCRVCVLFAPEFSGKGGHQKVEQFVTKPCTKWKDFHELCSLHMKC